MAYVRIKNPPQQEIYALTNHQILRRRGTEVNHLPLEYVPTLSIFSDGMRGTVSFGAVFPMWSHLENAAYVKTMIELAQENRLKEITS